MCVTSKNLDPDREMKIPSFVLSLDIFTFFINPFHCEKLFIVKGAHISNFNTKSIEGDSGVKMCNHDVSGKREKKCKAKSKSINEDLS